jgi:peptidoglycan/LPS O-acetylase OafA/YrhL
VVDLVRALAILMVMAGHLKPTLPLPTEAFRWGWDHFQRTSPDGVYVFFVVSGFLITRIIDLGLGGVTNPSWKYFYVRRVARIIPLFLFQVLLGLLLISLFSDGSKKFIYCFKLPDPPGMFSFWVSLLTFSFNWASAFFSGSWNGIGHHWSLFWSLSIEEQFYLFYPLILKWIGNTRGILAFLALVAALSFGGQWVLPLCFPHLPVETLIYTGAYGQIATGAILYLTSKYYGSFFLRNKAMSFIAMSLGFLAVLFLFVDGFESLHHYLTAIGIYLFLLGGMHLPFFQSKFFRVFAWPGKYSYGNYLLHVAVLYWIHSLLWNLNILLAFLAYVAASTVLAAFSFHFFETPANHSIRRLLGVKS